MGARTIPMLGGGCCLHPNANLDRANDLASPTAVEMRSACELRPAHGGSSRGACVLGARRKSMARWKWDIRLQWRRDVGAGRLRSAGADLSHRLSHSGSWRRAEDGSGKQRRKKYGEGQIRFPVFRVLWIAKDVNRNVCRYMSYAEEYNVWVFLNKRSHDK